MTLLIGGASALAALASLPRCRTVDLPDPILSDLFAAETVLFGLADLVASPRLLAARLRRLLSRPAICRSPRPSSASSSSPSPISAPGAQDDGDRRPLLRRA